MTKSKLPSYTQAKHVIWVSYDIHALSAYWETSFGKWVDGGFEAPTELEADLEAWLAWGDTYDTPAGEGALKRWSGLEAFSAKGFELAKRMKVVAGDHYNVVYFDHFKLWANAPPTEIYRLIRCRDC